MNPDMNLPNQRIEIDLEERKEDLDWRSSKNNLNASDEYEEEKFDPDPDDIDEQKQDIGSLMSSKPSAWKSQPHKRKIEYDSEERKSSGGSSHNSSTSYIPPPIDAINSAQFVPSSQGNQSTTKLPYYPIKIGNKTVEQLLIHNIDTSVKPIIGNKEIEKVYDLKFQANKLSFTPWKIDEITA